MKIIRLLVVLGLVFAAPVRADQFFGGSSGGVGGISGLEVGTTTVTGGTSNCLLKESGGALACSSMTDDGTAVTSTVPLRLPNGSKDVPSLTMTGSTATGFHDNGGNSGWEWSKDNVEKIAFFTNGIQLAGGMGYHWTASGSNPSSTTETSLTRAAAGIVGVTSGFRIGTNPATVTAGIGLANNTFLEARDAANGANRTLVGLDSGDELLVGDVNEALVLRGSLADPTLGANQISFFCSGTTPNKTCQWVANVDGADRVISVSEAF